MNLSLEQERLKTSKLAEQLKDLQEDQKLIIQQHTAIEKTLQDKISYLNEKSLNLSKSNEETQQKYLKEIQEKNQLITSLTKKIEVYFIIIYLNILYCI